MKLVSPKYFVMENVPNLLTAEGGYFRKEIEELFNDMGYSLQYGVLNASDYGVPQNRRRAVIIGKLGGNAPCLPKPKSNTVTIWDAISDLAFLESGEGQDEQAYKMPPESEYENFLGKFRGIIQPCCDQAFGISLRETCYDSTECRKRGIT